MKQEHQRTTKHSRRHQHQITPYYAHVKNVLSYDSFFHKLNRLQHRHNTVKVHFLCLFLYGKPVNNGQYTAATTGQ